MCTLAHYHTLYTNTAYTHARIRTHTYTHTRMHAHTRTHARTRTHMHAHTCTRTHACTHTYTCHCCCHARCLWPLLVAPEASLLILHLPPVKCFFLSQNCSSKYFMKQLDRSLRVVLACPNASKMLMTCRKRETVTVLIMCLNKMG